ncbi:MAG: hypothetical protein EB078_07960, partial [Proteobacteria bacterium]|nr:hypothetical protein [Pseudomonadota bacterium]
TVSEGAGTVPLVLNLEYASFANATIPFTISGTATNGVDFSVSGLSITIPAGQASGTIDVTLLDDFSIESDETIIITMGTPTGALLGTTTTHVLTIADNDNQPTVSFNSASQTIAESGGTVTVGLTMSKTYSLDVTIPFTVTGTASRPQDHNLASGSVTIAAGNLTGSVSFSVVDDSLNESNETVILTMGSITNGNAGATSVHTVTITDNDPQPTIQFASASQSRAESIGTVTLQVNLSAASSKTVSVPFTVSGTTSNPTDHNLSSGTITVSAGSTSGTTTFSVVDDSLYEGSETVIATLGAPSNATLGATTVHTVTITDNEAAPTVTFSSSAQSISEGGGSVTVTITQSAVSGLNTTIPYSMSGTATQDTDYSVSWTSGASSGTTSPISIPAGSTSAVFTFSVIDDAMYETNETAQVTMTAPTNASLGATSVHTVTINNNDAVPVVAFSASGQEILESTGTVYVLMVLSNPSYQTITIPYSVSGTATSPADHNLNSGSTTISSGNTEKVFTFTVVNDAIPEASETVVLTMGSITNGSLGSPSVHTVTILANDRKFSLEGVKLWLDSSYSLSTDVIRNVHSWNPRFSLNSSGPILVSAFNYGLVKNFWGGLPGLSSIDRDFLGLISEKAKLDDETDKLFAVIREQKKDSYDNPEICRWTGREIGNWIDHFEGQLSEILWLSDTVSKKNEGEIELYLRDKYGILKSEQAEEQQRVN